MMVVVRVYQACLTCDCPSYQVSRPSQTIYPVDGRDYIRQDNIMECEHERVCKFIDGQEPIEIRDDQQ